MRRKPHIRWSRLAALDLESAHTYLAERNPEAARRLAVEVQPSIETIRDHPEIGPVARDLFPLGKYRHTICGRYRVIYRIESETVLILRIWDSRRNPADLIAEAARR